MHGQCDARPTVTFPAARHHVTAHWLVPKYTAWWQRHMYDKNLPRVALDSGEDGNPRPVDRKSSFPATWPPSHTMLIAWVKMSDGLQCQCTDAVMEKWYKNCSSNNSGCSFNYCVPRFQTRRLSSRELSVQAHWICFNEPEPEITYYLSALVWAHYM